MRARIANVPKPHLALKPARGLTLASAVNITKITKNINHRKKGRYGKNWIVGDKIDVHANIGETDAISLKLSFSRLLAVFMLIDRTSCSTLYIDSSWEWDGGFVDRI